MPTVRNSFWTVTTLGVLAFTAACGGEKQQTAGTTTGETATAPATTPAEAPAATTGAAEGTTVTPDPGGQVHEIRMTMASGGRFEPDQITAKPGDVLKFVNVENVHNIHFRPQDNPGVANLPAPSPFLSQPGQVWEMKVEFEPGRSYHFVCDPHIAAGMVGDLKVEQ
jgi:plastocyanin